MTIADRILTIVITATLTSALWIVIGGSVIENASGVSQRDVTNPAKSAPSPDVTGKAGEAGKIGDAAGSGSEAGGASQATDKGADGDQTARNSTIAVLDSQPVRAPSAHERLDLLVPVLNVKPSDLTDTFAYEDEEGGRLHEAIDIMAPAGTSVIVAAPGTIEKLYSSRSGGKTVYIRSIDRKTIFYYAHLQDYSKGLREGQRVRRGQRLGSVGATGNAHPEAPHLHFAMSRTSPEAQWWEPANAINPYPLLGHRGLN